MTSSFERERFAAGYRELTGELPASVGARWDFVVAHGRSDALSHLEGLRAEAVHANPLGMKVTQLVQFGQLLALGREEGARFHAEAAVRHGATVTDLLGVSEVAFVSAGAMAYNLGVASALVVAEQLSSSGGARDVG